MKKINDADMLAAIVRASNHYAMRPALVLDNQTYTYQELFGLAWSICETLRNSIRLMFNGEVGYNDMRSREIDACNYGWHGNLNLGWQQNLPWQLKWSSNMEWMSRRYSLQGYDSGMMMISATLARSFLNDKLDVAISGMSGLGHGGKMYCESVSSTRDFTNISRLIEPMQDITIGITYTFGGKSRKYAEETVSDSFEMGDSRIVKQQMKRRGK